jgi:hypothetical protein
MSNPLHQWRLSHGRVKLRKVMLVGAEQKWLSTTGFLDKVDENLKKAMA